MLQVVALAALAVWAQRTRHELRRINGELQRANGEPQPGHEHTFESSGERV
jgi:hypothetical protein